MPRLFSLWLAAFLCAAHFVVSGGLYVAAWQLVRRSLVATPSALDAAIIWAGGALPQPLFYVVGPWLEARVPLLWAIAGGLAANSLLWGTLLALVFGGWRRWRVRRRAAVRSR